MSEKPVVLVDPHFRQMSEIFSADDLARLHDQFEVIWGKDEPMPLDEARQALTTASAVVCADWRYGDILPALPSLRGILTVSGGMPRNLDYDYCFAQGIRILSAAPAFARPVAEMALALALSASRSISSNDRAMRVGQEQWLHAGNVGTFMLFNKPVGFIGYGSLARALQPLLQPFGCPISVYDPWLVDGYLRSQGVTPISLEQLLETSRVIFVLAAPTSENQALLSRTMLERIQPNAVLVLVSRAHVVDFEALTDLVVAGRFKAGIDVFPTEPLAYDHPLRSAENAVLSAHRAGPVEEALWDIGSMVIDDLTAITQGFPPQRLQVAQPELIRRYMTNTIKKVTP
ncbi:MAG: hydroxyacid dehydrogenase [Anaerolineae bacterium]|nr:hydroxyacid dehydrogenase [Anaerolineae bacterium]